MNSEQACPETDQLMDGKATCAFLGGTKPIDRATLWRGVKSGRYPPPVKIGPNSCRWLRSECQVAVQRLIERRPPSSFTVCARQTAEASA
jgi:predicted DNA-binding transcriptional regulator AlpA